MSYTDVEAVVEGAVVARDSFDDEHMVKRFIATEARMAKRDGLHTEVYVLFHDHEDLEDGEECSCAQYVTNHHPTYEWNAP